MQCSQADGYCDAVLECGRHSELVSDGHSMQEKWHVPYSLCLELLQCMGRVKPGATWFLTIFGVCMPGWWGWPAVTCVCHPTAGGAGSFTAPCRHLGLMHVSVSYDRPSNYVDEPQGSLHLCMDLADFTLEGLLLKVWVLTGLHVRSLLGVASHPGCETFSYEGARYGYRDTSEEGFYLPLRPEAFLADGVAFNAARNFFPAAMGWWPGPGAAV